MHDNIADPIIVGKLTGVYGIKGWLKVFSYTDPLDNILSYQPWLLKWQGQLREMAPLQSKKHGKGLLVQLPGVDNPETARALVGAEIFITRKQLPALAEGEYYWMDLEGMTVINQANITLGKVIEVLATGANDVLVIKGDKRHLIPFLRQQTILSVDLAERIISVDWDADF